MQLCSCVIFCPQAFILVSLSLKISSIKTQSDGWSKNWNYSNIDRLKECSGESQSPINIPRTGKTISQQKLLSASH